MVSVIDQFSLVNNSNSKGIKFAWANGVTDNITVNNISINSAGSSSTSNFVANFGGFKRIVSVDFALHSDGSTDKSTDGSSKISLSQQWDHLLDTVLQGQGSGDSQSDVTFTLTIFRDDTTKTYTGGVEDISLNGDPGSAGTIIRGTMNFIIGTN